MWCGEPHPYALREPLAEGVRIVHTRMGALYPRESLVLGGGESVIGCSTDLIRGCEDREQREGRLHPFLRPRLREGIHPLSVDSLAGWSEH